MTLKFRSPALVAFAIFSILFISASSAQAAHRASKKPAAKAAASRAKRGREAASSRRDSRQSKRERAAEGRRGRGDRRASRDDRRSRRDRREERQAAQLSRRDWKHMSRRERMIAVGPNRPRAGKVLGVPRDRHRQCRPGAPSRPPGYRRRSFRRRSSSTLSARSCGGPCSMRGGFGGMCSDRAGDAMRVIGPDRRRNGPACQATWRTPTGSRTCPIGRAQ